VEIENTVIKDLNINEYKCNYDKIIEEDENKEKINWVCMHCFNLNFS
jgi:hypothetical protein